MQSDLPKTINEAIKILAYNDYFWSDPAKGRITPHSKDYATVRSLAEAQYAWTEKQAKLAVVILKRYATKFQKYAMDITALLDNPVYEGPFRVINFEKTIDTLELNGNDKDIILKFPYHKKVIQLIRILKDNKCLPAGYSSYDGESKTWTFKHTDVTTYYLCLIAIRYDFKFLDQSLLDDFDKIRKEISAYKKPTARLVGTEIVLTNAPDSMKDYWEQNIKGEKPLIQLDKLKEFGISTRSIKIKSWSELGGRIARCEKTTAWIDRNDFSRDQVIAAFQELDCFPILMPVTGDPWERNDFDDWKQWLMTFERNKIDYKQMAFGFEFRTPRKEGFNPVIKNEDTTDEEMTRWQLENELYQLSKQFKYVDQNTKVIFVRNRIPRSVIKSGIKPKCSFVAIGGGYYLSGTDALKRYLDSLPKTLYYNDHQPSSYDWNESIIKKV